MEERGRLDDQQCLPSFNGTLGKKELLTNWMRRTSWDETFSQARCDMLLTLLEVPLTTGQPFWIGIYDGEQIRSSVKDEYKLAIIVWLRGRFPDRPYKAPFELVMRSASESQYRREFKRCLCFWLRVLQLPKSVVPSIIGRGLSEPQREMLEQLWSDPVWKDQPPTGLFRVENDEEGKEEEEDSEDEDESDYEDSGDTGDDEEKTYAWPEQESGCSGEESTTADQSSTLLTHQDTGADDPCSDVVLELCYSMAIEDFEDGTASSSLLVYFSAVRGLSRPAGDEFLRPHQFTPVLSRLIYCTRLIFLEMTLPRFPHRYAGIPARPSYGHLRKLMPVRTEKMYDGTMSPLDEFLSLLSYGRALSRSEGPVYHFYWSEDDQVLSWDGCLHLSMSSFRGLAREALRQATIQCQRLMFDWEPADPDLGGLRDRLSTAKSGYSFVSDAANGLNDAYLELLMRACTSSIDGILKSRGQCQSLWNAEAAQAYLDAHDVSLKTLMVLYYLDSGQAARISKFDDTTCAASGDAAFAWQSGHRPMQRYSTYGLDGAFPDQLQPALLRIYARISADWHKFLSIADGEELGSANTTDDAYQVKPSKEVAPLKRSHDKVSSYILSSELPEKRQCRRLGQLEGPTDVTNVFEETISCGSVESCTPEEYAESPTDRPILTAGPFIYLEQLRLVLCNVCSLSAREKKEIICTVSSIPGILKQQDDLLNFPFLPPETKPLPFIEAPKHDGLRCNDCGYVTRQTGNMQKHCREKHGWQNDWTKGGNVKQKSDLPRDLPWTSGVSCQRLFNHGRASNWFEVGLAQSRIELKDFKFPDPLDEPIPYLKPPTPNCKRCHLCGYANPRESDMRHHYRKEHQWKSDWIKGGNIKKKLEQPRQVPWVEGVWCQRFFEYRQASRWFEVCKTADALNHPVRGSEGGEDAAAKLMRLHQEQVDKFNAAEEDEIKVADEKKEPSAWLERIG
ncbi:hypothetical protein FSPOR_11888 [Fusarium sporotrichioides]|uniref:C2H2-type domain-containing protein n=1 Tax=Fusarium sporotrichioides TaxID=5514 RepID=A0A395REG3_FUSSP|nr:hypothetical protein FSPOR_11888 [Fusarium sporotrichioides]